MKLKIFSVNGICKFSKQILPLAIGCLAYQSVHSIALAKSNEVTVPLDEKEDLWKPEHKVIKFRCKDMKFFAQSYRDPKIQFPLSSGLVNSENCKKSTSELESQGCFCDEGLLKCLESQKQQPWGVLCPTGFLCYELVGKKSAVFKLSQVGNYYTRKACEAELKELPR